MFQKLFKSIFIIVTAVVISHLIFDSYGVTWAQIYHRYFPCRSPIAYSIGTFDTDFGISQENFLKHAASAEAVWEKAIGRELFDYDESGSLKINLIYDFRQVATEQIENINEKASADRAQYDAELQKYKNLRSEIATLERQYKARVAAFEERQKEYAKDVEYWNARGGAPAEVYAEMKTEERAIEREYQSIKNLERELNQKVSEINKLVSEVNALAKKLNLSVAALDTIDRARGEEFTQGEYKEDQTGARINIYEWSSEDKLVRVLAHELGHALGLGHVDDSGAIMYRLNENKSGSLTEADISALRTHCKIE